MKFFKTNLILFAALIQLSCLAQTPNEKDLLQIAREVIASSGPVALITLDENAQPRVRAMSPFEPEEDFSVWLATIPQSRKVDQIRSNPNVTLYYLSDSKSGYVTIRGTAELIDDTASKEKYWKKGWEQFYPDYPDNYLLIKVTPTSLELISEDHGIVGDKDTWTPPIITFDK